MTTAPPAEQAQPLLISLAGVAELAQVRRPVASLWRSRSRGGDAPFPAPAVHRDGRDLFDAAAVARWLVETGHGRNPDAVADAAAAADGVPVDFSDPAQVAELSALIVLRARTGRAVTEIPDLAEAAAAVDPDDAFLRREVERQAAAGAPWGRYVDALVDAAYSPREALARVQRRAVRHQQARGSAGALDAAARRLVARLTWALAAGAGGTGPVSFDAGVDAALFDAVAERFGDDLDVVVDRDGASDGRQAGLDRDADATEGARVDAADADPARTLRRLHACAGIPVDEGADRAVVAVARVPHAAGASTSGILRQADDVCLRLPAHASAVVVGPARALVDDCGREGAALRAQTLRTGRLRAIVRLGPGHVTSAPREALALWVFGPDAEIPVADRVIAVADLTGQVLTAASEADLVSDILANLGGPADARAHAFRFARLRRTSSVAARSGALTADAARRRRPRAASPAALPTLVDAAVDAAGDDAPAFRSVTPEAPAVAGETTLGAAVKARHARVLPGVRLAEGEARPVRGAAHEGAPARLPSSAAGTRGVDGGGWAVVTAADLDHPERIGGTRVDPLAFSAAHPSAALTRAGDVVFRTAPTPAAWVDREGSHVVAYPARVVRVRASDPGGLLPDVIAADIAAAGEAGPGAWRRWRLRTVPVAQRMPLQNMLTAASITRRALQERIERLDALVQTVTEAVATGAVQVECAPASEGDVGGER